MGQLLKMAAIGVHQHKFGMQGKYFIAVWIIPVRIGGHVNYLAAIWGIPAMLIPRGGRVRRQIVKRTGIYIKQPLILALSIRYVDGCREKKMSPIRRKVAWFHPMHPGGRDVSFVDERGDAIRVNDKIGYV